WASYRTRFVKVMPVEYRRGLGEVERIRTLQAAEEMGMGEIHKDILETIQDAGFWLLNLVQMFYWIDRDGMPVRKNSFKLWEGVGQTPSAQRFRLLLDLNPNAIEELTRDLYRAFVPGADDFKHTVAAEILDTARERVASKQLDLELTAER